jgi:hypothetical protein
MAKRESIIHRAMSAAEFAAALKALGLNHNGAARLLGYSPRMVRRYAAGDVQCRRYRRAFAHDGRSEHIARRIPRPERRASARWRNSARRRSGVTVKFDSMGEHP